MGTVEVIQRLVKTWTEPRRATHRGVPTPFSLSCTVATSSAARDPGSGMPQPVADLWRHFDSARLFEDKEYGQWGLVFFSAERARERTAELAATRAKDYISGDVVVGEFLGDSDVVVVRCDPEERDFGHVLIALPVDARIDWYKVADDLDEFLRKYEQSEGAKFWEER